MFVSSTSVEHAAVAVKGVRAQVFCSFFLIEPLGSKKSRVTHLCRTDTRCVFQTKSRTEAKNPSTLEQELQAPNLWLAQRFCYFNNQFVPCWATRAPIDSYFRVDSMKHRDVIQKTIVIENWDAFLGMWCDSANMRHNHWDILYYLQRLELV